jgi:lysozyme
MTQIKGIDISSYQGNITDLGQDIDFVIIKASEGTSYQNPFLGEQRDTARRDGKIVGFYHFADLTDATAEADHFLAAVGTLQPGEFLAVDWETGGYTAAVDAWSATFINRVHAKTGVVPLLYSNAARINSGTWPLTRATNAGLWEAAYQGVQPSASPWPFAAIWQNSSTGSEQGVAGNVDTDIFFGDRDQLKRYGAGGSVSATPAAPTVVPPASIPSPVPVIQASSQIYVVNPGDTLGEIASKFGTTYQHLATINGIADPNKIYVGQRINTGSAAFSPVPAPISRTYIVVGGDTLSGIAARYGTTWQVLQSINGIPDANKINVDQVLRLP